MELRDNLLDFNKICRLCLTEETVMSSIYNENETQTNSVPLPLRIMACVSVEVSSTDGLPSLICATCMYQVDGWYKFKDLCENADSLLRRCLSNEPVQMKQISQIRTMAEDAKKYFTPYNKTERQRPTGKTRGDSKKRMRPSENSNEDGNKLYSLLKFGVRTSPEQEIKQEVEFNEGLKMEEKSDTEEDLAPHFEEDFSSDDSLTLSAQRKLLQDARRGKKVKSKKNVKKERESVKVARTIQTQTCHSDNNSLAGSDAEWVPDLSDITEMVDMADVAEMKEEDVLDSLEGKEKKKIKSRKTQTPREKTQPKKRFRVRPAVPSACTLCDKVYKNSEILRQHIKSHHVTGSIECAHCQLTFTSLRSLKYHEQRKHSNLEPVPCTFCGKEFLDKKYLRIHENIHSQTNQYVCQFCGRRFIMKTNLTVHISRHHTLKSNDFVCQVCGKAFPFKLYLKKHFKTHTDYKPHECNYCEAKFRENTLLRKHINSIHLKLRPFLCQFCHKTFTRSLYLREHMESQHLGIQKKIECLRCGENFQNRNRLRQHECEGRLEVL